MESLLKSLFVQTEEGNNPLMGLIGSLTNTTAKELVEEAKEVKAMLLERNRN